MAMKIVMVDQDGVVCDQQYHLTAEIDVRQLVSTDMVLVPNSDTPLRRLIENFRELLGFEADIAIAENGAVVKYHDKIIYLSAVKGLNQYRQRLIEQLSRAGFKVVVGDSATMVRRHQTLPPNSTVALVDEYREQSVGLYLFQTDHAGMFKISDSVSQLGLKAIQRVALPVGLKPFNYNSAYGIAIATPEGVSKTAGYRTLQTMQAGDYFMVGDSKGDIINAKEVVHCCVGNAMSELRQVSDYASPSAYTAGLKDCLRWIMTY